LSYYDSPTTISRGLSDKPPVNSKWVQYWGYLSTCSVGQPDARSNHLRPYELFPTVVLELYKLERTCLLSSDVPILRFCWPKRVPKFQWLMNSRYCAQWLVSVLSCTVHTHAEMRAETELTKSLILLCKQGVAGSIPATSNKPLKLASSNSKENLNY
jgi:hypothetical protein